MTHESNESAGIELTGIWLKNFLSTGAVTQYIPLNSDLLTLVLGLNTDANGGETRNGAGKTTAVQALSYVLFGQALDRIKADNLINNINMKNMLVAAELRKRGDVYRIERGRKPNVLKLYENEVDTDVARKLSGEEKGEMSDTQDDINKLIGMDHKMFAYIVALNTNTIPFFKASAADQRDIVEKLMGVTQVSEKAKALSKMVSTTKRQVESEEAKIAAIVEANRRIQIAIDEAEGKKSAWEAERDGVVGRVLSELEKIDASPVNFDNEIAIFDTIDAFVAADTKLAADKTAVVGELALNEREVKALEAELATLHTLSQQDDPDGSIGRLTREIANLRDQVNRDAHNAHHEARRAQREAADAGRRSKVLALEDARSKVRSLSELTTRQKGTVARFTGDRQREAQLRDAKLREREAAHGTDCATCGQSLEGSDHLHKIEANLDAQLRVIDEGLADLDAKITEAEAELLRLTGELEAAQEKEKEATSDLQEFEASLPVVDEGVYVPVAVEDTADILVKVAELESAKASAEILREGLLAEYESQKRKVEDVRSAQAGLLAAIADITKAISDLGVKPTSAFRSRDEVYRARQAHETRLAELMAEFERSQTATNPFVDQVNSFRDALQIVCHKALNEAKRMHLHQDTLLKLLTQKDSFIRKRIIEQNLANLNERMAHYLGRLGLPHTVYFNSDMTVDITYLGRDYDYDQMSRGEKNRIIMSTSLAFRDVWESLNHSINLLFVDELLDNGLCTSGSEAALGILKTAARQRGKNVFLISHKEELRGRVEKTLMVKKVNGFSEFQADEI